MTNHYHRAAAQSLVLLLKQAIANGNPQVTGVEQVKGGEGPSAPHNQDMLAIQVSAGAAAAISPASWIKAGANAHSSPGVEQGACAVASLLHQIAYTLIASL